MVLFVYAAVEHNSYFNVWAVNLFFKKQKTVVSLALFTVPQGVIVSSEELDTMTFLHHKKF